jgi:competence protein ComEA
MKIKKIFDQLFLLSKSERNGAIVLLLIVGFLLIVRLSLPLIFTPNETKAFKFSDGTEQFEAIQDSTVNNTNVEKEISHSTNYAPIHKKAISVEKSLERKSIVKELFQFNPNQVSFQELIKLGFSQSSAKSMINYRLKGGIFRKPNDIKKIYGVDSLFFNTILPYIILPKNNEILVSLEINSADSADFTKLKGIGPVFASRICKFRNQLGGFVSIEQLKEVYQFPIETFNDINDLLILDLSKVKRININFVGINDLKKHPYCKYENARKIVDYRSKNGYIEKLENLVSENVVDTFTFKRLSPYLKIE